MSDHTDCQLAIYTCPPEQRDALLDVIVRNDLGFEWGSMAPADALVLGEQYVDDSASMTAATDIASEMIAAAPGAAFVIWTDPKYEWMGDVVMYTPELGRFDGVCDSNGNVVIAENDALFAEVDELADGPPPVNVYELQQALRDLRDRWDHRRGLPWSKALDALREAVPA